MHRVIPDSPLGTRVRERLAIERLTWLVTAAEHAGYLAKYESSMPGISGSTEAFGAEYPGAVEVSVRRVRGF